MKDRRQIQKPAHSGDRRNNPSQRRRHSGILRILWIPVPTIFNRRIALP